MFKVTLYHICYFLSKKANQVLSFQKQKISFHCLTKQNMYHNMTKFLLFKHFSSITTTCYFPNKKAI